MPGLQRWMMPVVHTQLRSTDDLEIEFGGVMKCVSYLKLGLAYHENKPAPATYYPGKKVPHPSIYQPDRVVILTPLSQGLG